MITTDIYAKKIRAVKVITAITCFLVMAFFFGLIILGGEM